MSQTDQSDGLPIGGILSNRYQIASRLGVGGFGEAYLAADKDRFDAGCVVKRLRPDRQSSEIALRLFEREARALADLQHPRIPKLLAYFERDNEFFLVQEFVQGETLESRLAKESRLDESFVRGVVLQILEVLDYLQARNPPVIHRDIKPSNLIIDHTGQVYLIDFGAMREAIAMRPSEVGTSIGTSGYTPSEQIFGQPVPASDLYALAATALNLLSGESPHGWLTGLTLDWQNRMPYSRGFADYLSGSLADLPRRFKAPAEARRALLGTGEMNMPTMANDRSAARASRGVNSEAATMLGDMPESRATGGGFASSVQAPRAGNAASPPSGRKSRPLLWAAGGVVAAAALVAAAMVNRDSGSKSPATTPASGVAVHGDTCSERALKLFRTESQFDLRVLCPKDWTSFRSPEQRATQIESPDGTQIWASIWMPASATETLDAFAQRWRREMEVVLGPLEMASAAPSGDAKVLNYRVTGRRFATSPPGSVQIEQSAAAGNRYFTWSLVVGMTPVSKPTAQEVLTSIEYVAADAVQPPSTQK
ncbi:MAG TPA: serine/threonine-protein kinase [Gemmatimonadaceae bacterium]|jgi:serine/threonine protein kinase